MDLHGHACLALLEGMAAAGMVDRKTIEHIGTAFARHGNQLMLSGQPEEGHALLTIAEATLPLHDRLEADETRRLREPVN